MLLSNILLLNSSTFPHLWKPTGQRQDGSFPAVERIQFLSSLVSPSAQEMLLLRWMELPLILREKVNSTTYHPPPQGQGCALTKAHLALCSPKHSLCSTFLFWLSLPSEPLGTARDHCRQPINAVFKATHPFLMDSPLIWGLGHEFECCALNTSSARHPGFASG